jgi:hypothetical protein
MMESVGVTTLEAVTMQWKTSISGNKRLTSIHGQCKCFYTCIQSNYIMMIDVTLLYLFLNIYLVRNVIECTCKKVLTLAVQTN